MKLNKFLPKLSALVLAATIGLPASALVVLDNWQLDTPEIVNTTNIGHLSLSGGGASIEQEVDNSGNVFVGASFAEAGFIFSTQWIQNTVTGLGDNGLPKSFLSPLEITFANVTGFVSEVFGSGGFKYVFTGGDFFVYGNPDTNDVFQDLYATGSIVGIGGVGAATNVVGGVAGSSSLLTLMTVQNDPDFIVRDSLGNDLIPDFLLGQYFFEAITTNTVASSSGLATCSFNSDASCAGFKVTSDGTLDVLKVPEPGSIALFGAALLAFGFSRRSAKNGKA